MIRLAIVLLFPVTKGAAEGVARAGAVPGAASDAGDKGRCRVYISPYYRTGQKDKGRLR